MFASIYFKQSFSKDNLRTVFDETIRYKSAVGIDRISTRGFQENLDEQIDIIYRKVKNGRYKFSQYREKLISRGSSVLPRIISIPTIRDKLVQKCLFQVLNSIYGHGPLLHEIINNVTKAYHISTYDCVLKLDIKNFYPSVKHSFLLDVLKRKIRKKEILSLIKNAIETTTVSKPTKENGTNNDLSIPQGLSISNILANIYMQDLDKKFSQNRDFLYFRYVDDILIFCRRDEQAAIREQITEDCAKMGLEIPKDSEKCICCEKAGGFSYLGYSFEGSKITVRKNTIEKLRESLIKNFTHFKHSSTKNKRLLEWVVNLRITGCIFKETKYGWLFFFSQINDLKLLFSLGNFIKKQILRFKVDESGLRIKKFVRSYHEITKNLRETTYIPNFDNLLLANKRQILGEIFKVKTEYMLEKDILYQFNRRIYRSVRDLERDLARPS